MNFKQSKIILFIVLGLCAVFSFTFCANAASSQDSFINEPTIRTLDEKKTTVTTLTASAAGASLAVSALPNDLGTPISEKLADLTSVFMVSLVAIYLEKYLVTILGGFVFRLLVPICIVLWVIFDLTRRSPGLKELCVKVCLIGIAAWGIVPVSELISRQVQEVYGDSIQETVAAATSLTEEIQGDTEIIEEETEKKDEGLIGAISGALNDAAKGVKDGVTTIVTGVTDKLDQAGKLLDRLIESAAIMVVTSCVFPLVVMLFFRWLINAVCGIRFSMPMVPHKKHLELDS